LNGEKSVSVVLAPPLTSILFGKAGQAWLRWPGQGEFMKFKFDRNKIIMLAVGAVTFVGFWQLNKTYFSDPEAPTVCLIAGEGVTLSYGNTMILMDGLYRKGFPEDQLPSDALMTAIENAEAEYANVDLVTVSHKHIDHFAVASIMKFMDNNMDAHLVLPFEAAEEYFAGGGGGEHEGRVHPVTPERGTPETLKINGISITVYNLDHGTEVENIGILLELGGKSFFHMGDFSGADFEANGIKDLEVDYLLLPYWYLRREENYQLIKDNMNAEYLVPIHMPGRDLPEDFAERVGGFDQLYQDVSTRADNVLMLNEEGACFRADDETD